MQTVFSIQRDIDCETRISNDGGREISRQPIFVFDHENMHVHLIRSAPRLPLTVRTALIRRLRDESSMLVQWARMVPSGSAASFRMNGTDPAHRTRSRSCCA